MRGTASLIPVGKTYFEQQRVFIFFVFRVEGLVTRNIDLESANASLQKRMADLVRDVEDKAANFRAEMARKVSLFCCHLLIITETRSVQCIS
jgi:hypothetical protein